MLTWNGDVCVGDDAERVLRGMQVVDRQFTKTTGVQSDGKNTIWLVEVEGQKAILKRTEQFYRSLRCQVFLDELKPLFGIAKMGCVLLRPSGQRPTLLMRFVGTGQALISIDQDEWLWDDRIVEQLVKICLFDMVVANSSRKARNVLWGGPGVIVPIDEEQAMDFRIQPEFRMNGAVRRRLTMVDLDPYLEGLHLGAITDRIEEWRVLAERFYQPEHALEIAMLMGKNAADIRRRFFKFLDTSYGAATRSGVPSRSKVGPMPWEREP
jgi:hypothetical protein